MAREFAKPFYSSAAWERCRRTYILTRQSIDGGICELCHERPGYIVHHKQPIQPWNIDDPYITLSFDNLMYVCKDCHEKLHGNTEKLPEGAVTYTFDADGNPIPEPADTSRHS